MAGVALGVMFLATVIVHQGSHHVQLQIRRGERRLCFQEGAGFRKVGRPQSAPFLAVGAHGHQGSPHATR